MVPHSCSGQPSSVLVKSAIGAATGNSAVPQVLCSAEKFCRLPALKNESRCAVHKVEDPKYFERHPRLVGRPVPFDYLRTAETCLAAVLQLVRLLVPICIAMALPQNEIEVRFFWVCLCAPSRVPSLVNATVFSNPLSDGYAGPPSDKPIKT